MNKTTHRFKIDLIRDNKTIGTVEPNKGDIENDDLKISSTSSIYEFPTASFESFDPEINKLFLSYSKQDLLRISLSNNNLNDFEVIFEGEFNRKETKFDKEKNDGKLFLNIHAIHSFYKLSMLELTTVQSFNNITFKDFVHMLVNIASIPSQIIIEDKLSKELLRGISKHTNALRLFKEVCLLKNAVVTFNRDNSVNIDKRIDKFKEIHSKTPTTITDKDIISMSSSDKI